MKITPLALLLLLLITSPLALAQEDLDDTIFVVDELGSPNDIINIIELPKYINSNAADNASRGIANANKSKDKGRKLGQDMAEDARNKNSAEKIKKNTPSNKGLGRPENDKNPKK
ncbi:hypothetical protein [Dasania marina]|uniref:hypothetical protein n=1 Tax=Dasania marina TaxID=471499 RepID=UPI0003696338|nr:hypothetical protein [Dasania marina]